MAINKPPYIIQPISVLTRKPKTPASGTCERTSTMMKDMQIYFATLIMLYRMFNRSSVKKYPIITIEIYVIPVAHAEPTRPIHGINARLRMALSTAHPIVIANIFRESDL